VVHSVVLACVSRTTAKKVVNFFDEISAPSREIPGYAYAFGASILALSFCASPNVKSLLRPRLL